MTNGKNHHKALRGSIHSRKPFTKNSRSHSDKINLIIQLRDSDDKDILKIRVSSKTKLGEIKKYISEKYGEESNILYLTQINPNKVNTNNKSKSQGHGTKSSKSKIDLIFKSSIGTENEEAKLRVPRDIRIGTLKDALASRFGLSSSDFELVHVD